MTTTANDRKQNARKALTALGLFRADVRRWFRLLKSRFFTAAWKHLDRRDYLGMPERLADSGAELVALLNGFIDEPAINQSTLAEVIGYCVECEKRQLSDSPQRTRFFLPALDILEADLRRLAEKVSQEATGRESPTERYIPHRDDVLILEILHNEGRAMHQHDISTAADISGCPLSRATVMKRLKVLRGHGLVDRPQGVRGGDAIAPAGSRLLRKEN